MVIEDTILAKWSKPRFLERIDFKARNQKKKLFYEMVINTWSVFDEE
jgi:hypothetical protein